MIYLILFYAILRVRHWLPVAGSTVFTTLALVVKVLFYFTQKDSNVPQYLVVLSSFIVAWVELWMMPFQVLQRERRHTHAIAPQETSSASTSRPNRGRSLAGTLTDEEFRSAMEYSSGSSDEENVVGRPRLPSVCRPYSNAEYIQAGRQAVTIAKRWYDSVSTWQQISADPLVKCTNDRDRGKVYYVKVDLSAPPERVFRIVYSDSDQSPKWNKSVKENRVVLRVDDTTDVCYSVSAPALRGYIASRDFLDARYVEIDAERQVYTMAIVSVNSTILPPNVNKRIIRGENGPNIWILKPLADNPNHTSFEWIMNTDVK
uniref:START domain-containing protein n=1 Tax=Plectus sambesii TaxID=2011161 RepID=A0A914V7L6_9BILA